MKTRRHSRQHGQAMVEFLVAAIFFLIPCFLGMVVVGKFINVQHTTDMAARYAVWERTVWYDEDTSSVFYKANGANQKSAAAINNEIAVRLLNDRSSPVTVIKNTDKNATTFANGLDPMWHDVANVAYLDKYTQLSTAITRQKPKKDFLGAVMGFIDSVNIAEFMFGSVVPPVPTDTLAVAKVQFSKLGGNSDAYKRLWPDPAWTGMDFEARGAILSNTWYANGSGSTKKMVEQSVPTAQGMGTILKTAMTASIGSWEASQIPRIEVGKVAVDQLPPDRLK